MLFFCFRVYSRINQHHLFLFIHTFLGPRQKAVLHIPRARGVAGYIYEVYPPAEHDLASGGPRVVSVEGNSDDYNLIKSHAISLAVDNFPLGCQVCSSHDCPSVFRGYQ